MSDWHLEFGSVTLPPTLDADVFVIAGDIHPEAHVRDKVKKQLEQQYGIPVIMVEGNHDFYYADWPAHQTEATVLNIGGVKFACATLWTYLSPSDEVFKGAMADFRLIKGITVQKWNSLHLDQMQSIVRVKPDVVVTHHAPSYLSLSDKFRGDPLNPYFMSEAYNTIVRLKPKLWFHGHVHQVHDYTIGDTRVLCNPYGYPGENVPTPTIKYVEI
jgi:Icc-related predicted phosphoesterase